MQQLIAFDPSLVTSARSCLFGFVEHGNCAYNANDPVVFLGLGGALAVVGLILAVYQLKDEKWSITLRIKSSFKRNLVFIFSGIGLFFALVSSVITQVPFNYLPVIFTVPLFYEILSFFFLILSPVSLFLVARNSKDIFNESNSRIFYETLVFEISKTNEISTNSVIEILKENFNEICKVASDGKTEDAKANALAIIDVILSDSSISEVLATKRLDALLHIISTIEKYHLSNRDIQYGFQNVCKELLSNENSFLYKQLENRGLSLSLNVYSGLFGSNKLLERFDFFSEFKWLSKTDFSPKGVKVLIKSLNKLIETYYLNEYLSPQTINSGIKLLSGIYGTTAKKAIINNKDNSMLLSDEFNTMSDIIFFLTHTYRDIGYGKELKKKTLDHESGAQKAKLNSVSHVNEALAGSMYKIFEQMDLFENSDDVYHTVLDIFDAMNDEKDSKPGYRKPFEERIWIQVAKNVVGRYYPNATKTFLVFGGYLAAIDISGSDWSSDQAKRIRRLLYIDIKPLLELNTDMVNKKKMKDTLLPNSMDYKEGKFFYMFGFSFSEGKWSEIPEPIDTTSAFDGIDLENLRMYN